MMSRQKRSANQPLSFLCRNVTNVLQENSFQLFEYNDYIDIAMLPSTNDSDIESDSDSDDDLANEEDLSEQIQHKLSYRQVFQNYYSDQKFLEENHVYDWVLGEVPHVEIPKNEYLLKEHDKKKIHKSSPTELFEIFFSNEMKNYIIESSAENGLNISMNELNIFLGIIILTILNKRTKIQEYWSSDPFLECSVVKSAMSRNKFQHIKGKIKFSKQSEQNQNDCAWRVRTIFEMFRKNLKYFGFFQTALSVDEMMIKFFGRLRIKQFIRNKPIRFGIKMWALCGADGFLFDCDIYGGKNATNDDGKLSKCALGSRVVLNLLEKLLLTTVRKKLERFHLYCDNFFTSPDLFVHLQSVGIKATGVVRKNRVREKNDLDKKASRGTHIVKHDKISNMNFITLMDSKEVSMLSTAAGVGPEKNVKRYSNEMKKKVDIKMPAAFSIYNKYMGGVDIYDQYCNKALPSIRSKKWTFFIFMRCIQSSISNAVILSNAVQQDGMNKSSLKEFAISIAKNYLQGANRDHNIHKTDNQKYCSYNCGKRSYWFCEKCN